jgi:hypothetical protein
MSLSYPPPSSNTATLKRILLVDDEADVISLFKMVLEMIHVLLTLTICSLIKSSKYSIEGFNCSISLHFKAYCFIVLKDSESDRHHIFTK